MQSLSNNWIELLLVKIILFYIDYCLSVVLVCE